MSLEKTIRVLPTQKRAKERVEAILSAARQHYEEVGRDRFNFDGVAELANCSSSTVYRYFEDRVVLLDLLYPDRDRAEIKLAAIRTVRDMTASAAEKWLAVEHILDQD